MKQLLVAIALLLSPGLCLATTNCRSVELPDHFEAVCDGDEKAIPVPDTQSSATIQYGVSQQQTAPMQMQVPAPPAAPSAQSQPPAALPSQTPQPLTEPDPIVHRQGRQQYKKGMDDARDARQKLIKDLQQQQGQPAQ